MLFVGGSFIQYRKSSNKPSISISVDVATDIQNEKGIKPKFTLSDLRDAITQCTCGDRGQSRKFIVS